MTTVVVTRRGEAIEGLCVEGHAGFGKAGQDIVCAAASVLIVTCINAMQTVAGVKPLVEKNPKETRIAMALPSGLDEQTARDAQVILRTTLQGFTDISSEYPKHLKIIDGRKSSC